MKYSDDIVNNCTSKNECVWPNCQCCKQSGNSGELNERYKRITQSQWFKEAYSDKSIGDVVGIDSGKLKPDWEKEANYNVYLLGWDNDGTVEPNAIKQSFINGCNHVYETLVKPLQEENKRADTLIKEIQEREKLNWSIREDQQRQIAALKEEKEHFHKLYIEQLNINVKLRDHE